jgi:hypothetical protein
MASNNPAPNRATGAKKYIRLKAAAHEMEVSYMWLYRQVVQCKAIPHVKRGRTIMIPIKEFTSWSQQTVIP